MMYVFIFLFCLVYVFRIYLVYTCLLQDDPLSKTGYVGGNGTNISAGGSTDQRKVGPTTVSAALGKNVRKRSGKTTNASEEESDQDGGGGGEFQ